MFGFNIQIDMDHKPKNSNLCIFFLFLSIAELVTKLYEAAVRKVPTSEEYHSHLFMAYARVGEYKKMQQVLFVSSLMSSVFTSCLKNKSGLQHMRKNWIFLLKIVI